MLAKHPLLHAILRVAACAAAVAGGISLGMVYRAGGLATITDDLVSGVLIGIGMEAAALAYRMVRK